MLIFIIILLILCMGIVFESRRELRMVRATHIKIENAKVPTSLKGKKIAFLSDFHEAEEGKNNEKILSLLANESPDYVLLGGDFINSKSVQEDISPAVNLINSISETYPTYMGIGNHEERLIQNTFGTRYLWDEFWKKKSSKLRILSNEKCEIPLEDGELLSLYCLAIPIGMYARRYKGNLSVGDMERLIGKREAGEYNILLAHDPTFFETYAKWDADLVLSGHYHGGIVRLPGLGGVISPRLKLFPKYCYGKFHMRDTDMVVSNGLGQHTMKLKINNIPEVVILEF